MATTGSNVQGRFLWYELQAQDLKTAIPFYEKLFGWKVESAGMGQPYELGHLGGVPVTGLMELPEEVRKAGAPPHWMGYIGCDNLERTIERAKGLGATLYFGPHDIPQVGRIAVIGDPQGAAFTLYTPAQDPGAETEPVPGLVSWHELTTTDYVAAFRFYRELFGWDEMSQVDMGELGIYFMFGRNGKMVGGMFNKTPDMPVPPNWGYYFKVKNCDEAAKRIGDLGGSVINGPMEVPGGDRIAQAMDPQGAYFAVHASAQ